MSFTKTKSTEKVFSKKIISEFSNDQRSLFLEETSITYGKSILNLNHLDSTRMIYEYIPPGCSERLFRSMLLKNISDSEAACKGSGFVANLAFLKSLKTDSKLEESLNQLKKLSLESRRCDLNDMTEFLENFVKNKSILEASKAIINEGGFGASCNVESTYDLYDSIKLDKSSVFRVKIDPNFSFLTKKKEFSKSNANIIIADGVIETVSEIHHILERFNQNKEFCLLICRGYGNEVISTLSKNFLRGSLNIVPGVLVFNVESINSLKDICVISDSDIISTLKGDTFSSFDLDEIRKVDYIKIDENKLDINNMKNYSKIVRLSENIKKQIQEEVVEDKKNLLEKRLASLNPRKLNIYFSNHEKDSVGIKKDQLKNIISIINGFCISGKISLSVKLENNLLKEITKEIKSIGIKKIPANILLEGINVGIRNAKMIKGTKKVILSDS